MIKDLEEILAGKPFEVRTKLKEYVEKLKKGSRTDQQNKALHKYYALLANALNEGGFTVHLVLKEKVDIDWDGRMVKELLWRPAQQAILDKNSTTELKKIEDIDKVYEHLNRHMAEKFELHVPWPSYEVDKEEAPLLSEDLTSKS